MNDRVVCDASAVVAMLLDDGPHGRWAAEALSAKDLYAPSLLPFECANVIRRQELSGTVSTDQAVQAHADLCDFDVELWPHDVLANRIWKLRANLSCYDAAYVALAELLDASLVTLDRRISGAPGLQCRVLQPS